MDRLRQGVFSSLGSIVAGASVCDLFAGTGAYGLEALSRGAASAVFVEKSRDARAMILKNIHIVSKSMGRIRLDATPLTQDALKPLPPESGRFNLVFADPPYSILEPIRGALFAAVDRILEDDGTFILEAPGGSDEPMEGWKLENRIGRGKDQATALFYHRDSRANNRPLQPRDANVKPLGERPIA